MSAGEMQAVLARLSLSRVFRQLFELKPELALEGYDLEADERRALGAIDRAELARFAESMRHKRASYLRDYYSLSYQHLPAEESRRLEERFLDLHPAAAHESFQNYAVRWGHFWEESLGDTGVFFAADLVRYERLLLEPPVQPVGTAPRPQPGVVVTSFTCDLPRLLPELGHVDPVAQDYGAGETHYAVVRLGKFQLFRINLPTYTLMRACDGQRELPEICRYCERALQVPDLKEQIPPMLEQLCQRQLLHM